MKSKKIYKFFVFFISILLVISIGYFAFYQKGVKEIMSPITTATPQEKVIPDIASEAKIPSDPITITTLPPVITTTVSPVPTQIPFKPVQLKKNAWIPSFDSKAAISSFASNKDILFSVHFASGSVSKSGEVTFAQNTDQSLQTIQKEDIPFGVNIIFNDYDGTDAFLKNKTFQTNLENKLIQYKKLNNFKSVNLNIEKVNSENRGDIEKFLREFKEYTAKQNLSLYITIFPKTTSALNNTPTKQALDYKMLNEVADKIVLMAYDYRIVEGAKAQYDFANSPSTWVEEIIRFAKKDIDPEKIVIGLPLYGYGFNKTNKNITKSYTHSQIESIIKNEKLTPILDNNIGEMTLDRGNEIIIYQSDESLNIKQYMIKNLGVNEVFYWRIGGEGSLKY